MIHGFTGSPSEFRRIAYELREEGYTIQAVRLPGHGTTPEDMRRTGWTDWYGHVLESYDELAAMQACDCHGAFYGWIACAEASGRTSYGGNYFTGNADF